MRPSTRQLRSTGIDATSVGLPLLLPLLLRLLLPLVLRLVLPLVLRLVLPLVLRLVSSWLSSRLSFGLCCSPSLAFSAFFHFVMFALSRLLRSASSFPLSCFPCAALFLSRSRLPPRGLGCVCNDSCALLVLVYSFCCLSSVLPVLCADIACLTADT